MRFIGDSEIANLVSVQEAVAAMHDAFAAQGEGRASNLSRVRAACEGRTMSAMGGVLGYAGVMGTKVYPTIDGRFNFLINLFSTTSGEALATMQGNTLTALRTCATTLLAARYLAPPKPRTMALFGSGQQAAAHARAFLESYGLSRVHIVDPHGNPAALACALADQYDTEANAIHSASEAIKDADLVITATRSSTPLFEGSQVRPGAFVAAIGSSKPTTREIDDALLARCACIAVEDRAQALAETGDFVLAADEHYQQRMADLGQLVAARPGTYVREPNDITLYKSVGVGLEDIALAHAIWRKLGQGLVDAPPAAD